MAGKQVFAAALLAVLPVLGSGCVAVNVGEPRTFVHRDTVVGQTFPPDTVEVLSVEGRAEAVENRLKAWLEAEIRSVGRQRVHDETVTVTVQKRLSAGVFPGLGEVLLKPKGALDPIWERPHQEFRGYDKVDYGIYNANSASGYSCVIEYAEMETACLLGLVGVPAAIATVENLLIEPFLGWSCGHDYYDKDGAETYSVGGGLMIDAAVSPKLRLLTRFSPEERARMGFKTCFDWPRQGRENPPISLPHFGLAGIHKHQAVFVEERKGPWRCEEAETRRTETVWGPYAVSLRIPAVEFEKEAYAGDCSRGVEFALPLADRGGMYEAILEFRSRYAGTNAVRRAWDVRTLRQSVWLQEKPRSNPQPVREVVERVVEKHYIHETRVEVEKPAAPEREFEVEKSEDGTWRVRILSPGLNALDVDRKAKPQILESLREEYASRNPDVPREEINAWATYTTEDGGRTLVYVGEASSLIPSLESLAYGAETRRGMVTMRLAAGADLRRSKEFVRENISAIVCDKNVALTAGERPPDGAKYRSLDENFADGVLTVEFEAVE